MYPFSKTFVSLFRAHLLGLMLVCAGLAMIIVFGVVIIITWFTAHLVTIDIGWLDAVLTGSVGILSGVGD